MNLIACLVFRLTPHLRHLLLPNKHFYVRKEWRLEKTFRKNILQNTLFHNELKKDNFDENIFINFVNRNFGSEENYLNYLKNQILIEQISGYFENKITYPVNLSKKIYNQLEETIIPFTVSTQKLLWSIFNT